MIVRLHALTRNLYRNFATSSISLNKDKKYEYYDLVRSTPKKPQAPIEALLMSKKDYNDLKKQTSITFEGNYNIDENLSPEQRIERVFGGRIKGESPRSSSRMMRGEPRVIKGVTVPDRPIEPDNCCMSGCINCVWELFNEDVKDWNKKRREAAKKMAQTGGVWPEDFHPPIRHLKRENLPDSVAKEYFNKPKKESPTSVKKEEEEESWGNVPVTIRVFAEMEKKMKEKKKTKATS